MSSRSSCSRLPRVRRGPALVISASSASIFRLTDRLRPGVGGVVGVPRGVGVSRGVGVPRGVPGGVSGGVSSGGGGVAGGVSSNNELLGSKSESSSHDKSKSVDAGDPEGVVGGVSSSFDELLFDELLGSKSESKARFMESLCAGVRATGDPESMTAGTVNIGIPSSLARSKFQFSSKNFFISGFLAICDTKCRIALRTIMFGT